MLNNSNKSSIALIETNRIKHLVQTKNGYEMIPLEIEDLPYVPVILFLTKTEDEQTKKIKYKLNYKLLMPQIDIEPVFNEEYNLYNNSKFEMVTTNNNPQSSIIYDNKNTITLYKLKNQETIEKYIMRKKRKLFELKLILDENIRINENDNIQKTYKK